MEFYTQDTVQAARNFKKEGATIKEIAEKFSINRNTLSRWFFDMPSLNSNHLKNQHIKSENKLRGEKYVNNLKINQNNIKLLVALIYWCEGYKYPNCNFIGFANSDVNLIETFLTLFRIGFKPRKEKFRVRLQLHDTHDKTKMTHFWSKRLKIPEDQFQKPTITKPQLKMKRVDYRGTCTIRYYDSHLYQEIVGIYEAFSRKIVQNGEVG